jgi:hypothetical protein
MLNLEKRRNIDLLVEKFWKQGYMTLSRKYGTYLPEPSKVGLFEVDVVARYKKNYAIGITVTEEDLQGNQLLEKIIYLSSRQTKFTHKRVMLFIGVEEKHYKSLKLVVAGLDEKLRRNIKVFQIAGKTGLALNNNRKESLVLFS